MSIIDLIQADEGKTLEFKRDLSSPRNFKELRLIEQWGTGVQRIFADAKEQGLPEPKIEEIGLRLRFTVYLAKPLRVQTGRAEQVEAQVEAQGRISLLAVIWAAGGPGR